jgi:hypothetical protein
MARPPSMRKFKTSKDERINASLKIFKNKFEEYVTFVRYSQQSWDVSREDDRKHKNNPSQCDKKNNMELFDFHWKKVFDIVKLHDWNEDEFLNVLTNIREECCGASVHVTRSFDRKIDCYRCELLECVHALRVHLIWKIVSSD